jgi:hypothetical protein
MSESTDLGPSADPTCEDDALSLIAASKLDLYNQAIEEYGKNSWGLQTMIKLAAPMEIPMSQVTRDITNTGAIERTTTE